LHSAANDVAKIFHFVAVSIVHTTIPSLVKMSLDWRLWPHDLYSDYSHDLFYLFMPCQ